MNRQLPLGLQLRASARFSGFVAGANDELLQQLQALAAGEGEAVFFCYGPRGCGKTHLLQACCQAASAEGRGAAYLPLRELSGMQPELLEGWEQYPLVCADDVDAIAGKRSWEEALFHLCNRIRERHGHLLVSAPAPPAALSFGLPDLASRLGWGPVYQIQPLDDEQRLQALQLRARQYGCELPEETGRYLLRRLPRDLPALFERLERLDRASLAAQRRLTVPFVKSVLDL
ncbi:MAG TPA: DnaA regulatory inactivator Hda [Gammaproteobacteria bacterium]|nr:DnaA regulatory inactivator Hda [Gammaproteobacteria bacterium]